MNENINLVEILKDAPKGTKLWSPICGECELVKVYDSTYLIACMAKGENQILFDERGRYVFSSGECLLFPSEDNRDWSIFKLPKKHKHFEPYQKILVSCYFGRSLNKHIWCADLYSHFDKNSNRHCGIGNGTFSDDEIIPYKGNEDKLGKPVE